MHIFVWYVIYTGLPTVLRIPVPPKPKPPVPEFSTLPKPRKKRINPLNVRTLPKALPKTVKPVVVENNHNGLNTIVSPFPNLVFSGDFIAVNNNNYTENEDDYIPSDRIKKGRLIGEGEFASVYEGECLT